MILSRKGEFIGRFFPKPTKKIFLVVKTCFVQKKQKCLKGKNVSFDGSFSQRFENTQFIVSLPSINGLGSSELRDHMSKRGDDLSKSSSGSDERTTGERGESLRTSSYLVLVAKCIKKHLLLPLYQKLEVMRKNKDVCKVHAVWLVNTHSLMRRCCSSA